MRSFYTTFFVLSSDFVKVCEFRVVCTMIVCVIQVNFVHNGEITMSNTLFWNNITVLCDRNGIAPSALAKKLKLSPSSAAKWRSGTMPQKSTLKKIADEFNVPMSTLTTYDYKNDVERYADIYNQTVARFENLKKKNLVPVLGRVAAGIPIEEITDIEDYEEISDAMAANGEYFALKIHGDSMEPRMCEGDVIIVRKQENVESGETAVVSVNGFEATCKKVCFTDDGVELVSMNAKYKPMVFTKEQAAGLPIKILGKVVEIRCKSW